MSVNPDDLDRVVKLLADSDPTLTFPEAEALAVSYRLQIVADAASVADRSWQAAILTAANAGKRAMLGGVTVFLERDAPCELGWANGRLMTAALAELGAELAETGTTPDADVPTIVVGDTTAERARAVPSQAAPRVQPVAGRWIAGVRPVTEEPDTMGLEPPSILGAVIAAALAVSECFQWLRGYVVAGDRSFRVSVWDPVGGSEGPELTNLPGALWLLGLGHLGQAYLWLLALISPVAAEVHLVLQDDDRLSTANRATSMLHRQERIGMPKTRLAAEVMESYGFTTNLVERRYHGGGLYQRGDPMVLLAGLDNVPTRARLDETGFPLIIDAGLGAGPDGYLDMMIRRLPGGRSSQEMWSVAADTPTVGPQGAAYDDLVARTGDRCGVEELAGRAVATAFVGVVAAGLTIGGLLREMHGGPALSLVDFSLRNPGDVTALAAVEAALPRLRTIAV